uniref:NADH-ubiquinone oxidoreductase chain 4 n=1 Tax=Stereobalanus canadensis TaxID=560612 RepID=A0A3Q8HDI7_9BILA|nr:NADH dehydrogenase subunit 4 [Stereobalanus canadensis]AXY64130.1 NADH dehydrogenase subunit 4 [Stereobalanus canadensis]
MLTMLLSYLGILLTILITPSKKLFATTLLQTALLALLTLIMLFPHHFTSSHTMTQLLLVDSMSAPLSILSVWLLPLTMLASHPHLSKEHPERQRMYIILLTLLTFTLMLTFNASNFLLFYITFETTLMPTLIIMTRWGHQPQRLQAGTYFMFYTLFGSLPLLIALLSLYSTTSTSSLPSMILTIQSNPWFSQPHLMITAALLVAFLAKLPIYTIHLWLPKAHVEAPMAGSMVLAAILLKLGGYGLMRFLPLTTASLSVYSPVLMTLSIWGALVTSLICLRQTDIKSLMAYSSVGHMSLVSAGVFTFTPWGLSGALVVMMAHGLASSALFCLANMSFERTNTRTLLLNRGFKLLLPLTTFWWILAASANLGLPPLPNLVGELLMMNSLVFWDTWSIFLTGLTTAMGATYSLFLYLSSQHSHLPPFFKIFKPSLQTEHLNLILHLAPLLLLIFKPEMIMITW